MNNILLILEKSRKIKLNYFSLITYITKMGTMRQSNTLTYSKPIEDSKLISRTSS